MKNKLLLLVLPILLVGCNTLEPVSNSVENTSYSSSSVENSSSSLNDSTSSSSSLSESLSSDETLSSNSSEQESLQSSSESQSSESESSSSLSSSSSEQISSDSLSSENSSQSSESETSSSSSSSSSEESLSSSLSSSSSSDSTSGSDEVKYYTLSGIINDQNGDPVVGVTMNISNDELLVNSSVDTDSSGKFEFINLAEGSYILSVEYLPSDAYKYESGSVTVEVTGDNLNLTYDSIVLTKETIIWGGLH